MQWNVKHAIYNSPVMKVMNGPQIKVINLNSVQRPTNFKAPPTNFCDILLQLLFKCYARCLI